MKIFRVIIPLKSRKEVLNMAEKSNMPYLAIVVLVAVVAVVVLVLNAKPASEEAVAGEATRTIRSVGTNSVKANSCNADDTCEVLGITATSDVNLLANHPMGDGVVSAPGLSIRWGEIDTGLPGPVSKFNGKVFVNLFEVLESAKLNFLRVGVLAGNGSAYVCVNSGGDVFRSRTPCV
ncbi:MAG TPA: hypothetical protein VJC21_05600 [Candidatus Nanoarchaeia archaeon]|nr:hypothetical protein [Candidatus Nanoarchaeia archaeon]